MIAYVVSNLCSKDEALQCVDNQKEMQDVLKVFLAAYSLYKSAIESPGGDRKRVTNVRAQHIIRRIDILNGELTSKF